MIIFFSSLLIAVAIVLFAAAVQNGLESVARSFNKMADAMSSYSYHYRYKEDK